MISVVVIDDESKARETILNILGFSKSDIKVLGEADSVQTGFDQINKLNPQLILLDIHLSDGTGFDLLKRFEKVDFKVIFITAHEEYAIQAFRFCALDYILKPIIAGDLLDAIDKAAETISREDTGLKLNALLSNLDKIKKIVLKTAESIHIVNIDTIIRCEADINYTTFYLENGEKLLVSKTLKEFSELLVPAGFFRTHQSHLVNLEHVARYDKIDGGHLVLDDDSIVPVSIRKKDTLFELFERM